MTTPDTGTTDEESINLVELFDQLARANAESGNQARVAAGTFALYPSQGGGLVLVLNVDEGPDQLRGTIRKRIGPAMIRTMQALGDSGGGLGALKALMPKRRARG